MCRDVKSTMLFPYFFLKFFHHLNYSLLFLVYCMIVRFIDRPLTSQLHHAHCILPSLASYVLSRDRQLVAAACHALLDRLPADMAACRTMTHFSPLKYNMVKGGVYFTKFLYAQIMQLKFSAPRKVGFSVGSKVGSELLEHDLGIKLVSCLCGVLVQICSPSSQTTTL